jgi:enoyl-CoA hydratase/carnithine racemase
MFISSAIGGRAMDFAFLKIVEKEKSIELVLNRAEALNALNIPMLKEIQSALRELTRARQDIVVFRGEGKAFCVGADLKERRQGWSFETYFLERVLTMQQIGALLRDTEKIVVAVLHGHVIGAGVLLSLYADLRLAADDTVFRLPEIDVGSTMLGGGYRTLVETIGAARAKELLLLGEAIDAGEAERLSLIHRKVPREKLEETLQAYVEKLSHKPAHTLKLIKKGMVHASDHGFNEMLLREVLDAALNHSSLSSQK